MRTAADRIMETERTRPLRVPTATTTTRPLPRYTVLLTTNGHYPAKTADCMADTLVREQQQPNHMPEFMEITRELAIQQLSNVSVNKTELEHSYNSIDGRLILNLSPASHSEDEVRFLKLGVGFRPVHIQKLQETGIVRAAESVTANLDGHCESRWITRLTADVTEFPHPIFPVSVNHSGLHRHVFRVSSNGSPAPYNKMKPTNSPT